MYLERVELFFKANMVGDDSKVFLMAIESNNYALLRNLLALEKAVDQLLVVWCYC